MKPCEIHAQAAASGRRRQLIFSQQRGCASSLLELLVGRERNGDEATASATATRPVLSSTCCWPPRVWRSQRRQRLPLRPRQALGTGSLRALPSPTAKAFRMPLPKLRAWLLGIVAPPLDCSNSVLQSSHLFRGKNSCWECRLSCFFRTVFYRA